MDGVVNAAVVDRVSADIREDSVGRFALAGTSRHDAYKAILARPSVPSWLSARVEGDSQTESVKLRPMEEYGDQNATSWPMGKFRRGRKACSEQELVEKSFGRACDKLGLHTRGDTGTAYSKGPVKGSAPSCEFSDAGSNSSCESTPLSSPTTGLSNLSSVPPGLVPPPGMPSHGSVLHITGDCKPCGWFWKKGGCQNGVECLHCHLCPQDEIKTRKKHFRMLLRCAPLGAYGDQARVHEKQVIACCQSTMFNLSNKPVDQSLRLIELPREQCLVVA